MTGDEHYREAERLLAEMEERASDQNGTLIGHQPQYTADLLMRAQAHATLALAAATSATGYVRDGYVEVEYLTGILVSSGQFKDPKHGEKRARILASQIIAAGFCRKPF